jgi:hypothetical protein
MNAVSPTRSTTVVVALSGWHSAGVARVNIMNMSKSKRAKLFGFNAGLLAVLCEPDQTSQATINRRRVKVVWQQGSAPPGRGGTPSPRVLESLL